MRQTVRLEGGYSSLAWTSTAGFVKQQSPASPRRSWYFYEYDVGALWRGTERSLYRSGNFGSGFGLLLPGAARK
jgi:hypothetical protein